MLYRYYSQTGDPDAINLLDGFADGISVYKAEELMNIQQFQMNAKDIERHFGWPAFSLVEAYHATGDPYYILGAKTMVNNVFTFQDTVGWSNCTAKSKWAFPSLLYYNPTKETKSIRDELGSVIFITGILNHATAKYREATSDSSISRNEYWVNYCLTENYDDDNIPPKFYNNTYNQTDYEGLVANVLIAAGIRYYGKVEDDSTFIVFADDILDDYNDTSSSNKTPTSEEELKKAGQITGTIIDMMDHFE